MSCNVPFKANRVKTYCKVYFSFCNLFDDVSAWCVKILCTFAREETTNREKRHTLRYVAVFIESVYPYTYRLFYILIRLRKVSFKRAYINSLILSTVHRGPYMFDIVWSATLPLTFNKFYTHMGICRRF